MLVPLGARLGEHPTEDGAEARQAVDLARAGRRGIPQDRGHRLRRIVAQKRMSARRQLVQDHAQREDVGPRIQRAPEHLLGGHVAGRAHPCAGFGEQGRRVTAHLGAGVGGERLGQPEVHHFHVALRRDHDVGGLEIAMHHAAAMGFFQGIGQLGRHLDDLPHREERAPGDDVERLAFHVFHGDEQPALGVADFIHLANERMVERRGGQCLATQPPPRDRVRLDVGRQHLDGDTPLEEVSCARNTSPIPPAPSGESMRYRPASRSVIFDRVMVWTIDRTIAQ